MRTIPLKSMLTGDYWILILSTVYFGVLAIAAPDLASEANVRNIVSNFLPLAAVTLGQMTVLLTGGIDLSQTAVISLASVIGARVMTADGGLLAGSAWAPSAAVVSMLAVGGFVGLCNGFAVAKLRMPAFMVSLATMMFFGGFAVWMTESRSIYNLPPGFATLNRGTVGILPVPLLLTAALATAIHVILNHTLYGRWLYAIGMNERTALISGVPVATVRILAYVCAGLCAACGSILYTARLETGSPVLGQRILLDVVGAAVIGGTSLFGGRGKVSWTLVGVLFVCLIDNSLNMLGLSNFAVMVVKGGVILLAAVMDAGRARLLVGAA